MNLKRFFQVTSLFLVLFTIQLFIYAFHEVTEAGAVPGLNNEFWHLATEPYGPEGVYGEWLTYFMVLIPAGWLALSPWCPYCSPARAEISTRRRRRRSARRPALESSGSGRQVAPTTAGSLK